MAKQKDPTIATLIGCNLEKLRKQKFPGHGGAKKCAETFGVAPQAWNGWEKGAKTPGDANQRKLAEFFGITVGELRGDEKAPSAKAPRAEPVTYDAVVNACLSVQVAISDVLLHLNRERDLKPFREDLKDLADTARSLQELLSDF